jgi:hypothetical protein
MKVSSRWLVFFTIAAIWSGISPKSTGEAESQQFMTAMHAMIGHGSGKLSPKLTREASFYLKDISPRSKNRARI